MFDVIKSVIERGLFRVNDISSKIDTLWAESKLTDDQREELYSLIVSHLNPANEYPDLEVRLARLEARISQIEARVAAIEDKPVVDDDDDEPSTPTLPDGVEVWEPWDGISKKYQFGAIVFHGGVYYKDVLVGQQNVWEPGSPGIDERYWVIVSEDEVIGSSGQTGEEQSATPESSTGDETGSEV